MSIAARLFAFMCVCVYVWVGGIHMCACDVVPIRLTFHKRNDRERVPDPNWAPGTLHTPPVIASTALSAAHPNDPRRQKAGRVVLLCLCVCVCVCVCAIVVRCIYKCFWKFQMSIAGHMFAFVHGCVCLCVCVCV